MKFSLAAGLPVVSNNWHFLFIVLSPGPCYNTSMLHLLLGKDIFAKQAYINDLAKQISAGQIWYGPESLPNLQNLLEPTLFQITQVVVFEGCLNNPDMFALLPSMQSSSDHFALVEEKLDKRKTEVTKLLKLNGLITNEFTVPREPRELSQWIITHAKNQSIEIQPEAALELVQRFGHKPWRQQPDEFEK